MTWEAHVWEALGYNADESYDLETMAHGLVARGSAVDVPHARRALAAATFNDGHHEARLTRILPWWVRARHRVRALLG